MGTARGCGDGPDRRGPRRRRATSSSFAVRTPTTTTARSTTSTRPCSPGSRSVADLDDDPEPEVLVINTEGITLLEHDGTAIYQNVRPERRSVRLFLVPTRGGPRLRRRRRCRVRGELRQSLCGVSPRLPGDVDRRRHRSQRRRGRDCVRLSRRRLGPTRCSRTSTTCTRST